MSIKGLDEMVRKLEGVKKATAALDGEITSLRFDPSDPQSIELAIQQMEAAIDERVADYGNNDMVQKIVNAMKERYRQAILDHAAAKRTEGEAEE